MAKTKYDSPQRDIVGAKIVYNEPNRLGILFYGGIPAKKNSRTIGRGISLPSANYQQWHKRCMRDIEGTKFNFSEFPCTMNIYSIIHNNVKKDLDNYTQSIQDFLTDVGAIPDDNNFILTEIHTKVVARIKNCPITYVLLTPLQYEVAIYDVNANYDKEKMDHYGTVLSAYGLEL